MVRFSQKLRNNLFWLIEKYPRWWLCFIVKPWVSGFLRRKSCAFRPELGSRWLLGCSRSSLVGVSWSWSPVNLQFSFQLEFRCWKEPSSPRLWLELLHTAACLTRVCLTHARTAFHGHVVPRGCSIWTEVLLPRRTEVLGPTSLKSAQFLFWIWNPKALWLWWAHISQLLGSCWEWAHSSVFLKTVHVLMVL